MPPVANRVDELNAIRQLFEDQWTACLVVFPGEVKSPPKPLDPKHAKYPAHFVSVAVDYDPVSRVTYGGTKEVRGQVFVTRWVQQGASDRKCRELGDLLEAMFDQHGDSIGMQFTGNYFEPEVQVEEELPWVARPIAFEFVRFKEAA